MAAQVRPESRISPLALSVGLHASLAGALALAVALAKHPPEKIELEVIEKPVASTAAQLNLSEQPRPQPIPKSEPPARKVFGLSRKALTAADEAGSSAVVVKEGNTVATAPDNEKLRPGDDSSLPIPTDEYLVSKMPSVLAEVRIPYPPPARQNKIEGKVVLELLIDADGKVRDVRVLSGPGFGLNEAAAEAVRSFKFRPAEVDGKPVAVRIPFTYNFLLTSD